MQWITRERVKVDRVACPWLIKKFVDPDAKFLFVPGDQVLPQAEQLGAIPTMSLASNWAIMALSARSRRSSQNTG